MTENQFPMGWDENRVRRLIDYYEQQTDEEAVAEDEAAFDDDSQVNMDIPINLVNEVRDLIARRKSS